MNQSPFNSWLTGAPRPLDDDDVSFLESKERQEIERLIRNEEEVQRELVEFRVSLLRSG